VRRLAVLLGGTMVGMMQSVVLVLGLGVVLAAPMPVLAAPATTCSDPSLGGAITDPIGSGAACSKGGSQRQTLFGPGGVFTSVANTLTFVVGAVSVIYLIIGGFRYVTSGGDSKAVTAAKDTILYAIIGVVVAIVAFGVVNFVVNSLAQAS